jgi:hypothetical protein
MVPTYCGAYVCMYVCMYAVLHLYIYYAYYAYVLERITFKIGMYLHLNEKMN